MTKQPIGSVHDLSIHQARLFEELKSKFYETNYVIQAREISATEQLKVLNNFHLKLIEFEKSLLELRERIRQDE